MDLVGPGYEPVVALVNTVMNVRVLAPRSYLVSYH
jgi:hypothetical protein